MKYVSAFAAILCVATCLGLGHVGRAETDDYWFVSVNRIYLEVDGEDQAHFEMMLVMPNASIQYFLVPSNEISVTHAQPLDLCKPRFVRELRARGARHAKVLGSNTFTTELTELYAKHSGTWATQPQLKFELRGPGVVRCEAIRTVMKRAPAGPKVNFLLLVSWADGFFAYSDEAPIQPISIAINRAYSGLPRPQNVVTLR
ncbi:MAG: hypothetical protein AAFR09_03105 [Pseudomonadota bacterium]